MRLTLKASCPMHLRRFPLDSQKCPLHISSYGYRRHDVMYAWCCSEHEKNVEVEPKVEIAQYDLINITTWGHKVALRGNSGKGVMTALSLTTLGFGGKAQMPKVSYPTALDWFVILCFSFVFATMVEYAAINFTDKLAKDLKKVKEKLLKKNNPPPKQIPEDETSPGAVVETLGLPKELTRSLSTGNLPSSGITLDVPHPSTSRQPQDVPREEVVEEPFTKKEVTKKLNRGYYFGRIKKLEDKEIPMSPPLTRRIRRITDASEGKYDPSDSPQLGGPRGIPVITVTRRHSDGNVGDLSFDSTEYVPASAYEEMEFDNVLDRGPEDDFTVDYERSNIDRFASSTRRSFRKFVMKPVRMWQDVHFLPDPEDTSRQMMSGEPRAKFTVLDITSRRWFPLSFIFLQAIYWMAYMFYITDDFPEKQYKILRRVRT
uniref:Neurotransmitter-gated ion-channel ligand-binding domain-containing protein n=1 Tax=Timema poppense TaxID=170557 RepID=A0A7R9DEA8_TIMPO|nr:unnamed protein product [Timema poppensis]